MALRKNLVVAALLGQLFACASSPSKQYSDQASNLGLNLSYTSAGIFELAIFSNHQLPGSSLNIYLEGDGNPFHRNIYINPDPTSKQAVALQLMAKDQELSYLVGRPCYHQRHPSSTCKQTKWWTSHRYSEAIVNALSAAIDELQIKHKTQSIRLIGFSGGGTLASLLAIRRKDVKTLVTVSANLDIDQWAKHNRYTPLFGSINPIAEMHNITAKQYHFVGSKDRGLGAKPWLDTLRKSTESHIEAVPEYTHTCCWQQSWQEIQSRWLSD